MIDESNLHPAILHLKECINLKNVEKTNEALATLLEVVRKDSEAVKHITEPVVISGLHRMLVDNFEVQPRAMLLKTRVSNRVRRAILFVQAMQNGMKKRGE